MRELFLRSNAKPQADGDPSASASASNEGGGCGLTADHLPCLMYLQGGPGFAAPRPACPPGGWMAPALKEFRLLLLDQVGTLSRSAHEEQVGERERTKEMTSYEEPSPHRHSEEQPSFVVVLLLLAPPPPSSPPLLLSSSLLVVVLLLLLLLAPPPRSSSFLSSSLLPPRPARHRPLVPGDRDDARLRSRRRRGGRGAQWRRRR